MGQQQLLCRVQCRCHVMPQSHARACKSSVSSARIKQSINHQGVMHRPTQPQPQLPSCVATSMPPPTPPSPTPPKSPTPVTYCKAKATAQCSSTRRNCTARQPHVSSPALAGSTQCTMRTRYDEILAQYHGSCCCFHHHVLNNTNT